ncbi:MAG TPA: outer membrane beta-barrel protein [Gemmatimonadales bacterium]|nr:outer membrane beta-barrel protein [Gemmatimonadales bacterium]
MRRPLALVVAAAALATAPLGAQVRPRLAARFWVAAGGGAGIFRPTCDACSSATRTGISADAAVGYDLSPRLAVALMVSGWTSRYAGVRDRQAIVGASAEYAPWPDRPIRIEGGLGFSRYTSTAIRFDGTTDRAAADGLGLKIGAGYQLALGPGWTVLLQASALDALPAALSSNGTPLGVRTSSLTLRFGAVVRWHWSTRPTWR